MPVGRSVTLNFDNGSGMEAYLPVGVWFGNRGLSLWVAEDGSTYWARDNGDGTHHGVTVTQDALYAMRYAPDGLARGAYDARLERYGSKRLARSPAIDAGSDDAWGYDTTSTHPKVIDMGQPDIGYHYYRRVADDDPIDDPERNISISFRQPPILKGGLPIAYYRITNTDPEPGQSEQIKVFDFETNPELNGKDVIEGAIVQGQEQKMRESRKYNLEARTHVDAYTRSAPSVFIVIVKPENP
jgi:hypothetical protein